MGYAQRIITIVGVGLLVSCSDDSASSDTMPACPAQILAGDRCEHEGLDCPFPQARCDSTRCLCDYAGGILSWQCRPANCSCACACEKVVVASCEMLGCTTSPDPCPAEAAGHCELLCRGRDGGPSDTGPELGVDGAVDGSTDGGVDTAQLDGPRDQGPDGPRDASFEAAPDGPLDLSVDIGRDMAHDRGRDITPPGNDGRPERGRE